MSIFSNLTPEQAEQVKNCKSKEELIELLKDFAVLSADQLDAVSGGFRMEEDLCLDHSYWTGYYYDCYTFCPHFDNCGNKHDSPGDPCEDVKPENVSSDFAAGRITGADFFA